MEDRTEATVDYLLAKERHEQIQSYVDRGRKLEHVSDEALRARFISEMRAWGNDPLPWEPLTDLHDTEAEAALRCIELPHNDVVGDVAKIAAAIREAQATHVDDGSPTQLSRDLEDYRKAKDRPN